LYHVRHVTNADVRFAQERELPRIFQVIYAGEGECRKFDEQSSHIDLSKEAKAELVRHKGHDFVQLSFHSPTSCDICSKQLWHIMKPPLALECRRCHTKIHKDHADKQEIAPCRVNYDPMLARDLLLMMSSNDECKQWVNRLKKSIEEKRTSERPDHNSSANGVSSKDSMRLAYKPYSISAQRSATLPSGTMAPSVQRKQ